MKPQQRKFIVEVKSARRRSTGRPAPIWGDTDLKAFVREAEAEVPHLFLAEARIGDQPPEVTERSIRWLRRSMMPQQPLVNQKCQKRVSSPRQARQMRQPTPPSR